MYRTQNRFLHSLLELPLSVVQRADLSGLQPARDAVEVERVLQNREHNYFRTALMGTSGRGAERRWWSYVADPPGHGALLRRGGGLVSLTLYA